jgi:uncharacterized protein (DUF3084 family)
MVKRPTKSTGGSVKGKEIEKVKAEYEKAHQKEIDKIKPEHEKAQQKEIEKVKAEYEKHKEVDKVKPEHEKAQQKEIEKVKAEYEKHKEIEKFKPEHEKAHQKEIEKVKAEYEKIQKEHDKPGQPDKGIKDKDITDTAIDPALSTNQAAGDGNADHFIAPGQRPDLSGGALAGGAGKGKPARKPGAPRKR